MSVCPLAERLFPLDGRVDALPAQTVIEAHGLPTELHRLFAQLYHHGELLVESATSQDAIPDLVDRLTRVFEDANTRLSNFLTAWPTAAAAIVIVSRTCIDILPAFAVALVFDVTPRTLVIGRNEQTVSLLHAPGFPGKLLDAMPEPASELLQLRMMCRALALEPSDRLEPRMFDRLAFHARNVAVALQEERCIEMTSTDDDEPSTRMGSRFPLLEEAVTISILRLHGALRRAESPGHVLDLETKLGEALEACGDHSHAGLLYSEAASAYRTMASGAESQETALWFRTSATIQYHNAGLAFKRCGSFMQAEAAYVKALQLVESKKRLKMATLDLWMVYDALVDASASAAARKMYLRCTTALACLSGRLPANAYELLLPEFVLMRDGRERLLSSLPGIATDPTAVRRAILAATNPRCVLVNREPDYCSASAGMEPTAAYSELVKDCAVNMGFCNGCHKHFPTFKLQNCACGAITYCSKDCQRTDWSHHKLTCAARKVNRKAEPAEAPTEESLERSRAEFEAMKLRHDEREAAEAAARKAAEMAKQARIAKERANRKNLTTTAPLVRTRPEKENAGVAAPAPTAAGLAKRTVAKEQSLEAQRSHQAALREQEEQRVAQAEQQVEMRKLGDRIARGE